MFVTLRIKPKTMKNYKNIIFPGIFIFLLFFAGNLKAQNLTQEEPGQTVREIAKDRTNMWIKELALSAKQADLMERKIIEYTMKRTDLMQSKMNEEAKKERYIALQRLEEKDMRDILTGPQYEKYIRLNRQGINEEN
jgi:hypothetical protein